MSGKPLDAGLYARALPALQFLAFDYLVTPDYERVQEEKRRFFKSETRNPDLRNTKLDVRRVQDLEQLLLDLRDELNAGRPPIEDDALWNIEELKHRRWTQDELIRVAYLWSIADQLAQLRVTRVQNAWDPREFQGLSAFAFGVPTAEHWHVALARVHRNVTPYRESAKPEVRAAAQAVARWLPDVPPEVDVPPDHVTIQRLLTDSRERFAALASVPVPTATVDAPEWREQRISHDDVRDYFAGGLKAAGVQGWDVVVDRRGGSRTTRNMSVNQERRQVVVPEGFVLSPKRALALMVHEIGTHLSRRVNGEASRLQLLGAGLDRYRPFEEGLAIAREGTLRGHVDGFDNPEAVLAIGLCRGMDGSEPRDFRGVFERMREYFYLGYVRRDFSPADAAEHANNAAWVRCVRTFRGTDYATPGVCATLDLAYLAGSRKFWKFAAAHPDRIQDLNVGKFDPTEERHVWLLRELGILDKERWAE